MKILVVANAYSIHTLNFIKETLLNMKPGKIVVWNRCTKAENENALFYENNGISIVQWESGAQDTYSGLSEGLKKIKEFGAFDVCHLHYLDYMTVTIGLLVRENCRNLICNYWGSDWLRANDTQRQYQKFLLELSDHIVTDSLQIYEQVDEYYQGQFGSKLKYIRFKTPVISVIESGGINADIRQLFMERYRIPEDKVIITCGYCASKAHDHKGIIKAVEKLSTESRDNLFIIVPMTYGKESEYIYEIKQVLDEAGTDFAVIEDYLSFTEVALLRLITDIFINIEPTDAYSSTMIEYTYCNKIVIIGKWLDYSELEKQGAYYKKVNQAEELTDVLDEIINNFDSIQKRFSGNRKAAESFQTGSAENKLWEEIYHKLFFTSHQPDLLGNGIKQWVEQNKYQNIGLYGAGLYGRIVYQKIIEVIGADHICVYDKNADNISRYPNNILKPEHIGEEEPDVIIVTPIHYMEQIKKEYNEKADCPILTYLEWLEEIKKVN